MLAAVEVQEELPRKRLPIPLRKVRLDLGMTQKELSTASSNILGKYGIKGVSETAIIRAERYDPIKNKYGPIKELTASRLLTTINEIHEGRGRPTLSIDDIIWNITDRKP